MRPLRYSINITLDGCCDHRAMIADEELHRHAAESIAQADALIFGRVTYEMMEAAWRPVRRTGARPDWMADWMEPFARTIDAAKKYVVSSTLTQVDWNAELVRGDHLETAVLELKQQPGKGLFVGGVKLPLALAELGLIDEYEFIVHPRLAGHGPTLFAGLSKCVDLKLVGQRAFASGAVSMRYEPYYEFRVSIIGDQGAGVDASLAIAALQRYVRLGRIVDAVARQPFRSRARRARDGADARSEHDLSDLAVDHPGSGCRSHSAALRSDLSSTCCARRSA
jgi:dihydrofolate reductase